MRSLCPHPRELVGCPADSPDCGRGQSATFGVCSAPVSICISFPALLGMVAGGNFPSFFPRTRGSPCCSVDLLPKTGGSSRKPPCPSCSPAQLLAWARAGSSTQHLDSSCSGSLSLSPCQHFLFLKILFTVWVPNIPGRGEDGKKQKEK